LTFRISIKKSAFKFLKNLDKTYKATIDEFLSIIKLQPVPSKKFDIVKLKNYNNTFRVRIGKLRIVYTIFWSEDTIFIQFIGWRKDAYK